MDRIEKIRFCRYKGFKFQIIGVTDDSYKLVSCSSDSGRLLGLKQIDKITYMTDVLKTEIEAIWTLQEKKHSYDSIEVEYGNIIVNDCELRYDRFYNDLIMDGEFASYNGEIYKSISGVNHNLYFTLLSLDIGSQNLGFIMEEPGKFYKQVNSEQVDFAFQSRTWCNYANRDFVVIESPKGTTIKIQPWSRDSYSESELNGLGFENLSKWIDASEADSIWTKTEKVFDFDRFENNDKQLK